MEKFRVDDGGRECTTCHEYKPWDQYSSMKAGAYGKVAKCKSCCSSKAKSNRVYAERLYKDENGMTCPSCKTYKPLSEYVKDRTTKSGYASGCKVCRYELRKKWGEANPEAAKASTQAWIDRNHDYVKAQAREYAKGVRDKLGPSGWNEAVKQYRRDNYDRVRARELANERKHREVRNYRLRHGRKVKPHVYARYDAQKRAKRLLRHVSWANQEAISAIYAEAKFMSSSTGVPHHVDHIYPLVGRTVSGLHVESNLRVLSGEVNSRKSNKLDPKYLPDDVQSELSPPDIFDEIYGTPVWAPDPLPITDQTTVIRVSGKTHWVEKVGCPA